MRRAILVSAVGAATLTTLAAMTPARASPSKPATQPGWRRACGWLVNSGPANWSLTDRFGEWELGMQGGHQASGLDTMPDTSGKEWEEMGPSLGQGCACLDIRARPHSRRVDTMRFVRQLPLKTCRTDPALKKP